MMSFYVSSGEIVIEEVAKDFAYHNCDNGREVDISRCMVGKPVSATLWRGRK